MVPGLHSVPPAPEVLTGSSRGWLVTELLKPMQDQRVLPADLIDTPQHPFGREVLGHPLEHLLALLHGTLLER
jgi:hypothetical protein